MKLPYQNKRIIQLNFALEEKRIELKKSTEILMQLLKDKASLHDTEKQITKRNLLFIDISTLEQQIKNLHTGKNQYGCEIEERSVRQWIN